MNDVNEPNPPAPLSVLAAPYPAARRILRLARKELREILRDRRTIVTLVAMPLLLYPLMSVVFLQFSALNQGPTGTKAMYVFGTLSSAEERAFQRRIEEGERAVLRARAARGADSSEPPPPFPEFQPYLEGQRPRTQQERAAVLDRLETALRENKIHLIVVIPHAAAAEASNDPEREDRLLTCRLITTSNSPIGQAAVAHVEAMFAAANEENLRQRLGAPGVMKRITMLQAHPIVLTAATEDPLAALVPLILILMTITGAVYPAIDLTAGERERGTLEILVAAPVARFELLSAKYVSVMTVALMTAIVNLACMSITVQWTGLLQKHSLSPLILVEGLGLLVLFAAFFSAVLLCVTSFARSFKEAQAYLIPLMLASMTPGVVAMMPGLKLEGVLSVLPLVNIVLLARDLFKGAGDPVMAGIVIVTTLLYALAALSLAARVFGAESVLYSEQSSWADLLRRPDEPQPAASLPAMLWCLAVMAPIHFSLTALLRALNASPAQSIVFSIFMTLLLFGLLPGLFVWLGRIELRRGLGLYRPGILHLLAGLLLGASLWPIELWILSHSELLQNLRERLGAADLLGGVRQARESLGWGVLAVVIVPAILEEVFFRGLLFQALKKHSGAWITIGVSAALFGATHLVFGGPIGPARLMPSLVLGLILGYVCWTSGSLWPGMVLHVCHNTILLLVGIGDFGVTHMVPWSWIAAGAAGAIVGVLLLVVPSLVVRPRTRE